MSDFTIRLSELIDSGFDLGLNPHEYEIFDEKYRATLNNKILQHYYNYEIGQETESMFRFALNRKMREIMPYYNQLYLSARVKIDPLSTVSITEVVDGTDKDTTHGTAYERGNVTTDGSEHQTGKNDTFSDTAVDSKARTVTSETPQTRLAGNEDYASGATDAVSHSATTATGNGTSSQDTSSTVENLSEQNTTTDGTRDGSTHTDRSTSGYSGISAAELLMQYRQAFLNIDMMVIEELASLFMQLWSNGDEFSDYNYGGYGYGFGSYGLAGWGI